MSALKSYIDFDRLAFVVNDIYEHESTYEERWKELVKYLNKEPFIRIRIGGKHDSVWFEDGTRKRLVDPDCGAEMVNDAEDHSDC